MSDEWRMKHRYKVLRPKALRQVMMALVAFVTTAVVSPSPSAAAASRAETGHLIVDGFAEVFESTCPFGDWVPEVATECEDWIASLFKESAPKQHNRAPWGVFLVRARSLVHPSGVVDTLDETSGVTYEVESDFDERHLRFARARASVPMSDGSTRQVNLAWDGSDVRLQVAGNTGPYHLNRGTSHHGVSRCFTTNHNYQQTYRAYVSATGTVDGVDVADIPYSQLHDPFIGRGRFTAVEVVHGACG